MPIGVKWDNDERTIIRYHVQDPWQLDEYAQANQSAWTMIEAVGHHVHVIVDFTEVSTFPKNLLSMASVTNSQIHPNQELVIGVRISPYLQTIVRVAVRFFPRLGHNLFFAHTLHEAYEIVRSYEAKLSVKGIKR